MIVTGCQNQVVNAIQQSFKAPEVTNTHLKIFLTIASPSCVYSLELSANEATLLCPCPTRAPRKPPCSPISCR